VNEGLLVNKALKESKDPLVNEDLRVIKDLLVTKGLLVNKDRPDPLGLLVVGHVQVLQKDTRLAFYRSTAQGGTFVFTPVSNRKESDA
jgi:hypothetical protein